MHKILVVDDEEHIRTLYSDELTDEGYDVVTTGELGDLMEMIPQKKPDLILLDIRMEEASGLDLLQDIRNTHYNIPVILCTAYEPFKHDLRSIAADFFVIKSSDLSELKEKIRIALDSLTYVSEHKKTHFEVYEPR